MVQFFLFFSFLFIVADDHETDYEIYEGSENEEEEDSALAGEPR